jgi:hypothetical protein
MKVPTLILSFFFTTAICFGQSNDLLERNAFKLNIAVDDTNFYSDDIKAAAYILPENTIQLYPGESIFVEIELSDNEIKSMKTVKANLHPEKTLGISFSQQTNGKIHKGMMLKIENPFNKKIEYKANMFLMKYNKWAPTSIQPIQPKLSSYETWSDLIVTIALAGWEFK